MESQNGTCKMNVGIYLRNGVLVNEAFRQVLNDRQREFAAEAEGSVYRVVCD